MTLSQVRRETKTLKNPLFALFIANYNILLLQQAYGIIYHAHISSFLVRIAVAEFVTVDSITV